MQNTYIVPQIVLGMEEPKYHSPSPLKFKNCLCLKLVNFICHMHIINLINIYIHTDKGIILEKSATLRVYYKTLSTIWWSTTRSWWNSPEDGNTQLCISAVKAAAAEKLETAYI